MKYFHCPASLLVDEANCMGHFEILKGDIEMTCQQVYVMQNIKNKRAPYKKGGHALAQHSSHDLRKSEHLHL